MAMLYKLRELTEKLPVLSSSDYTKEDKGDISYNVESGSCVAHALVNNNVCAAQYACMEPGTMFPMHSHHEIEILVIVKGTGEQISASGESRTRLATGSTFTSNPDDLHAFRAITQCEIIAITIPASEGYPKVD